jgi:hypothetical protein
MNKAKVQSQRLRVMLSEEFSHKYCRIGSLVLNIVCKGLLLGMQARGHGGSLSQSITLVCKPAERSRVHGGAPVQSKLRLDQLGRGTLGMMGDCAKGYLCIRGLMTVKGHAEGDICKSQKTVITP